MSLFYRFLAVLFVCICAAYADDHESCEDWAHMGECEKNPNYMLVHCSDACAAVDRSVNHDIPASFYDIVETDLYGNELKFEVFRDKVVYLVNVASYCGYTAENYELLRNLRQYRSKGLDIVIAPCNQFGAQEPGDSTAIHNFATKQDFEGVILSKNDVNGPKTRESFRYLKSVAGRDYINWNFDGKFLCDRDGRCNSVADKDVEKLIRIFLGEDEL